MPENLKAIIEAASAPNGAWGSVFIAVILSVLRILGDPGSNKWQRISIEAPTAGCIGYATGVFLIEQEFGIGAAFVVATMVGHLGTDWVRNVARKAVNKEFNTDQGDSQ